MLVDSHQGHSDQQMTILSLVWQRREIDVTGINMPDDVSEVTGSALRTINGTGIEQVDPSVVAGVAERIVELESGLTQVGESVVAGVAERQIDLESGVAQVDASLLYLLSQRESSLVLVQYKAQV